jgi:hypothetical protein
VLDCLDPVVQGGGHRRPKAFGVLSVRVLGGVRHRVDSGQGRLLDLGATSLQALGQVLADLSDVHRGGAGAEL